MPSVLGVHALVVAAPVGAVALAVIALWLRGERRSARAPGPIPGPREQAMAR